MIVNLGSEKCDNNNNSTCQLSRLQNSLLVSIVDIPEKDLSNVDLEIIHERSTYIISKVIITFFSSIRAMYNRVIRDQK